ncbi:MAG: type I-C CRISPR-associated protein Cas7/Csd2 [Desulfovibrio aminophilus]|uniref:type I-C CRISPR-associated protein Cas7/Csd2 n=1 Tax=Desulfovibrio aminophilus TaxID=81425 RepID=UPI0039E7E28A
MTAIQNRYEFVYLFDVENGNPNGDPDAGNLPRIDPETSRGLVTDVCLKRKVRNFVALLHSYAPPFDIYVKEKAVLGRAHVAAYEAAGITLGEESRLPISETQQDILEAIPLPEGLAVETNEDGVVELVIAMDVEKKDVQEWLKETKPGKDIEKLIKDALKKSKSRKPKPEEVENGKSRMLERFYDVRTFGAVMSLKSAPNCGQVRGPVQFNFARSVSPVSPLEVSITRMAVATEREAEKQGGDNRTMGRKHIVPYALYRAEGYVSAPLAAQTGFTQADLDLLWQALINMFDHDHSAARGKMSARRLIVFKHESALGNAPAHKLFDLVTVKLKDGSKPPRVYGDYDVTVDAAAPTGVTVEEKI